MKTGCNRDWKLWVLRLLLAAVFAAAGIAKLRDPLSFADSIDSFQLLPSAAIGPLALGLPIFEIVLAGWLLFHPRPRAAAFGIMAMLLIFTLALLQAMNRGFSVDCGCFGSGDPAPWKTWASVGRNVFLFAASAVIFRGLQAAAERRT